MEGVPQQSEVLAQPAPKGEQHRVFSQLSPAQHGVPPSVVWQLCVSAAQQTPTQLPVQHSVAAEQVVPPVAQQLAVAEEHRPEQQSVFVPNEQVTDEETGRQEPQVRLEFMHCQGAQQATLPGQPASTPEQHLPPTHPPLQQSVPSTHATPPAWQAGYRHVPLGQA